MTNELNTCPDCGESTAYHTEPNGDGGLVCTVCDWQAVEVVWFARGWEPDREAMGR